MIGYAYRDEYGILHVVSDLATAIEFAHSEVKEVDCEYGGGFPKVNGKDVFDYGNGEIYIGGNKNSGIPISVLEEENPEEAKLVKELLQSIGL